MFKRGYINGEKIIEIIEGNLDVVLYNEKGTSFYFYRFNPTDVIGKEFDSGTNIINQKEIKSMLHECGKTDYKGFINELIIKAVENKMTPKYEM
jgi:tRNA A58 N-methylase Trm61